MSQKTPTTWIGLIKELSGGAPPGTSLKDVFPKAKIEWAKIKAGTHPTKMVGTSTPNTSKKSKKKQHGGGKLSKIKVKATKAAEEEVASVENDNNPAIESAKALSSAGATNGSGQNMGNFPPGSDLAFKSNSGISGVERADSVASADLVGTVTTTDLSPAVYSQSGGIGIINGLTNTLAQAMDEVKQLKKNFQSNEATITHGSSTSSLHRPLETKMPRPSSLAASAVGGSKKKRKSRRRRGKTSRKTKKSSRKTKKRGGRR